MLNSLIQDHSDAGGMEMTVFVSALVALTILVGVPFAAGAGGQSVGDKVDDAMIPTKVKAKLSTEHAKNLSGGGVQIAAARLRGFGGRQAGAPPLAH
jgi:hypothetical protein